MDNSAAFESMLAEVKRHRIAKDEAERYEIEESLILKRLRGILSEDNLNTWRMVECLISGECAKSELNKSSDRIREKLMEV